MREQDLRRSRQRMRSAKMVEYRTFQRIYRSLKVERSVSAERDWKDVIESDSCE